MYRFPSSGTGNILLIEVMKNDKWEIIDSIKYVNTSKAYPEYSFDTDENIKSVRFTFLKVSGNLAIDDIVITHGKTEYVYLNKDISVNENNYQFTGLNPDKEYLYSVKSKLSGAFSDQSEIMRANTFMHTVR